MTRKLSITFLALIALVFSGFMSTAHAANTQHEVKEIIVKTAMSLGVDPCVALSIAKHESEFQAQKKSPYGAVGVFQLMPSTAKKIGVNPYVVHENIKGGIMYYKMMYKKFGSMDLALAAYNAGPGNVTKYNGVPPFRETKSFVNGIKSNYKTFENDPAVLKHSKPAEQKQLKKVSVAPKPQLQSKPEPVKQKAKPQIEPKITDAPIPGNTEEKILADTSISQEKKQAKPLLKKFFHNEGEQKEAKMVL